MTGNDQLAHALKLKFGTAPSDPNAQQLASIKTYILKIKTSGRTPTDDDWRSAVHLVCPDAGRYKYAGLDNSDLNTLLALATQSAQGQ
jgi:hypothetical protein